MLRQATGDSVEVEVIIATATAAEATASLAELKTAITNDVYPSRLTTGGAYPHHSCVSLISTTSHEHLRHHTLNPLTKYLSPP